ncbi:T9SS type A sorting domain-containing protein [bacterium]|nr:T9SS type A sorting domain-containing protein [bacterium]
MKKKLFVGVLLSVFSLTWLHAAPVNLGSAKRIAREFCDWQSSAAKGDILTCVYPKSTKSDGFVPYYIFNVGEGNGFVIVSGDDNTVRNVLAYSETGAFDMENLPDNVRYWLGFYEEQVQLASQMNVPARKTGPESHGTPVVAPLLGDISYNQSAPYNLLCPIDNTNGKQCVVGCVATAIVSIAKYYEYPAQGRGDINYNSGNGGRIKADLSQSFYDWSQILPTYEGADVSSTKEQDTAIALLMCDAGYGASMSYSSDASGATINGALLSAVRHLRYDSLTSVRSRSSYDNDMEWISMLKVSLDSMIPLYYTGQSKGGGHAFVCDGYDSANYFHINWGWGDLGKRNFDGFFLIQVLDPDGGGIGAGEGAYNESQFVLYNMVPNASGKRLSDDYRITTVNAIRAFGKSTGDTVEKLDVRLTSGLVNWTAADFDGTIALALYQDGEFVKTITKEQDLSLNGGLTNNGIYTTSKILQFEAVAQDVEEGDYEVWVVARSNRENAQWVKVHGTRSELTEKSYIAVKVDDGKFILRSESCKVNISIVTSSKKTIKYWVFDNYAVELMTKQTANKRVSLDVLKGVDYTIKFYVSEYDTATVRVNVMQDTNIEVRMKQKIGLPHIYLVRVMDNNDVMFWWQKEGPQQPEVWPAGYILYLDSVPVATQGEYTDDYGEYIFEKVPAGMHMFSVRSVFVDDTSEMVSRTLNVPEPTATETLSASDCKIYPNPSATGIFTLEVGQACRMQISSVTGKILYEDKFASAGQYTIPLQEYAAGMYIVRLFTEDNQSVLLKAFIR